MHTLKVTLPKNATGNVTFDINGTDIYGNNIAGFNEQSTVQRGKAWIYIPDLKIGSYTVTVEYSGDKNYDAASENITFETINIIYEKT